MCSERLGWVLGEGSRIGKVGDAQVWRTPMARPGACVCAVITKAFSEGESDNNFGTSLVHGLEEGKFGK